MCGWWDKQEVVWGGGRTITRPQIQRDSNDLLRFVQKADENSSSWDLGQIYCVGMIVLWIFFCLCTFFFCLLFISLKPPPLLICHLPQDLHPSIEYTQRTTQRNKSITHSITWTARHVWSRLGRSRRKVLWLLESFSMSTLLASFSTVSICSCPLPTRKKYTPCIQWYVSVT